jgi:hypothetical protein
MIFVPKAILAAISGPGVAHFRKIMNLIDILKYGILFGFLLCALPWSAFVIGWPLHNITGGIYADLGFGGVLTASMVLTLTAWSLLYTQGLIIDGIESRYSNMSKIHPRLYQFFNAQASWKQLGFYFLFVALSGTGIVIIESERWIWSIVAALLGIGLGYFIVILLCIPAQLIDPTLKLLPDPVSQWIWAKAASIKRRLFERLGRPEKTDHESRIESTHVVATIVVAILIIPGVIAWATQSRPEFIPALVYAYTLILFLIWTFSALDFWLARFHVNSLVALIIFVVGSYLIMDTDHTFEIDITETAAQTLTPVEVVQGSRQKDTLVVVVSSGGGIKAAAWTTLALRDLITMRPELADEIRLISTVSGGTVGAAYYLNELCHTPITSSHVSSDQDDVEKMLNTVHEKSVTSSLSAITYGFAFFDFWRLVTGGALPAGDIDRGSLLENELERIAGQGIEGETSRECRQGTVLSFREDIRNGSLPAFIFNATVMESGRRVMITPINFEQSDGPFRELRGDTLTEILLRDEMIVNDSVVQPETDLDLWTAVRLSAAFPYVTPAAQAKIRGDGSASDLELKQPWQQYHFVDGGYYDNFGVSSALDWLEPVLQARIGDEKDLEFKKVVIIQLRSSPKIRRTCYEDDNGAVAALVGPVKGLLNIRNGVALSRNEIELKRFIDSWNDRFELNNKDIDISTVVFEPKSDMDPETCKAFVNKGQAETEIKRREDPLSWHLTKKQIRDLEAIWRNEKVIISTDPDFNSELELSAIFELSVN